MEKQMLTKQQEIELNEKEKLLEQQAYDALSDEQRENRKLIEKEWESVISQFNQKMKELHIDAEKFGNEFRLRNSTGQCIGIISLHWE